MIRLTIIMALIAFGAAVVGVSMQLYEFTVGFIYGIALLFAAWGMK